MKTISLIFFILLVVTLSAQAESMTVVNVRSNIAMSDEDPVYRDYVIDVKDSNSLKKNLVVLIKRKVSLKNSDAKDVGDVETAVGQLKIIHVDKKVAVAREYKIVPRENEITLDYTNIMVGDEVDLTGAFIDSKTSKKADNQLDI